MVRPSVNRGFWRRARSGAAVVTSSGRLLTGLREAHADRRVGNGRAEHGDVGAIRRGQNPVAAGRLPQMAAQQVEELPRGVGTVFERDGELGDPVVVADEFLLA